MFTKLTPGTVRLFRLNIFFVTKTGRVRRLDAKALNRELYSLKSHQKTTQ